MLKGPGEATPRDKGGTGLLSSTGATENLHQPIETTTHSEKEPDASMTEYESGRERRHDKQ